MTVIAAWACLIATAALLVSLVTLHIARTGLSPISEPVSAYALTRFRALYATAAIAAAVAGVAAALLLASVPGSAPAVVLLFVFAAARALITLFPMDRPKTARSRSGRTHNLLAVTAFATVTAAAFFAAGPLVDGGRSVLDSASTLTGIAMAIGSVGVIAGSTVPRLRRVFGLAERLIYAGFIVWFVSLALGFLAH